MKDIGRHELSEEEMEKRIEELERENMMLRSRLFNTSVQRFNESKRVPNNPFRTNPINIFEK